MRTLDAVRGGVVHRLRENLVAEARALVGTPFFHAGREPGIGIDCVGVILVPARKLGLTHYRPPNYGPEFDRALLVNCVAENLERIDIPWLLEDYRARGVPKALAGDVLLFALNGQPAHLAYATGEGTMIHAHQKPNSVVEETLGEFWCDRLVSVWRWPPLAGGLD